MLYIRHGPKAYANGKSDVYPLDPELTEAGKLLAHEKFRQLLAHYQPPSQIISSPYYRARQTAQIAQSVILQLYSIYVPIINDPVIGEYLGNQYHNHSHNHSYNHLARSVRQETFDKGPLIVEQNISQLLDRIKYHYDTTVASNNADSDLNRNRNRKITGNCWFISHGLFIQRLAKHHGINLSYPNELCGFYIDDDKSLII